MSDERWYVDAFTETYLDLYAHRDAAAAEREVAFAVERLGLRPGARALDLCCGPGFHLGAFRKRGIAASGVDLSCDLLRHARGRGPAARGDMRCVPFAGPFAAVTAFFTSFGYFEDDENALVLSEISRLLQAEGGRFLLDLLSPAHVRRRLVPHSERQVGDRGVRETRWIEPDPPRVLKRVETAADSGQEKSYTESVRLYELDEMREMLDSAGLGLRDVFGGFDGEAHDNDSARMILVGVKAGSGPRAGWNGGRTVFRQIDVGGDRNFAYVFGEAGEGAAVDPIMPARVVEAAKELGLELKYVVNTHGHYDHTGGNSEMKRLTGARVIAHEASGVGPDIPVKGGEKFKLGDTEFEVLSTPGHSPCSICVLWEGKLVTGDTLFVGKVGGTDHGSGARQEYESLHEVIAKLPDETEVWPGHDVGVTPSSTVGREKETNPFYQQPDFEAFGDLKRNWTAYKREHGIK